MQHELQEQILAVLSQCHDMAIGTIRPDGAPQVTVVSFVHDGMLIYFGCSVNSQKAKNIAHEARVSVAMTAPYTDWMAIKGLSLAALAEEVSDPNELGVVWRLMNARFPQIADIEAPPDEAMTVFRLKPTVVSVLDYTKGFGHTNLVTVEADAIAATLESMRHHWLVPVAADTS
jgi:nitroimidazol reductase NimA-like FMN-containing flavoprotein (pyridoxamine 5'-phosphate oxidase superfamily)